jgi:hypothetical protein
VTITKQIRDAIDQEKSISEINALIHQEAIRKVVADAREKLLDELKHGELSGVPAYQEWGGALDSELFALINKCIRGEIKRKRGNRRTFGQARKEREIRDAVLSWQIHFVILRGWHGSLALAKKAILADDPDLNEHTLDSYLKNFAGLPKSRRAELEELHRRLRASFDKDDAKE